MNRTITTLVSLTMAVCALQLSASPRQTATRPSPNDFFNVRTASVQSGSQARALTTADGNAVQYSPRLVATATAAPDPKFVGICKDGGNITVSTATLGASPETSMVNSIQSMFTVNAGVFVNNKYNAVLEFSMANLYFIYSYDSSINWANTGQTKLSQAVHPTALTYDAMTSSAYGCFADDSGSKFSWGILDLASGMKVELATLTQKYTSMAADKAGTIYAIGDDNALYTIDKFTARTTKVGDTGITPSGAGALTFDNSGKILYWFVNNAVYTIDTASAEATESFSLPGQWIGVSALPEAEVLVPAWIDNLSVNFPKGALTGDVSFQLPVTATSGAPLSASVTYHLFVDDTEYTGSGLPGATVAVPITLESGVHSFRAYAEYEGSVGMEGSQSKFIGHDIPTAPANIAFVEKDDVLNLSWDAVTTGINGGYIDLDALRYSVVRNPGNVSIADGITEPQCTDASIDALGYYTYTVTASDGVTTSAPGTSPEYFPGKNLGFRPPFSHDFSTGMGLFTVNDANNDGTTWGYSDGFVWFITDAETDNDDWIVSPPVTLAPDKNYNLKIGLLASANWEYQVVEIRYGKGPRPEDLTNVILPAYPFQVSADIDTYVTPEEEGQYYFAVHVVTTKTAGAVSITNFAIGAGYNSAAPGSVIGFVATPAPLGEKSATISFICPDKNFGGSELTELTRVIITNETTGQTVGEITDATPSTRITDVVDSNPADGINTYSVVCYNNSGNGLPVQTSCWVGTDLPAKPENIRWIQNGNSVHISWEAPTIGSHGGYIGTAGLRYRVIIADDKGSLVTETSDLSCDIQPEFTSTQRLLQFAVSAINEVGEGDKGLSNESAAGIPYPAPFYESFENVQLHSTPWLVKPLEGYNSINIVTNVAGLVDMQGVPVTAIDYDYGMAVYTPMVAGQTRLEMPIIDISSLSSPVMKMWCFFLDDKTTITIQGNNNSGNDWTDIAAISKKADSHGWNMVIVPLDKFKGEERLQPAILCATPERAAYVLFDKISIEEGFDTDMVLADVTFPERLYAGEDFTSTLKINNGGLKESPACELQLFIDGKYAAGIPCAPLPSGGSAEIPLKAHLSSNATSARLQAQILCPNDADNTNNALMADVYVVRSSLPAPDGLTNISDAKNAVRLSWTAPECKYEAPVTDSFETLEAGSVGGIDVFLDEDGKVVVNENTGILGDYKLVDNDMLTTTTTMPLMNTPNAMKGMVCQVIDVVEFNLRGTSAIWEAHSGNKLLSFWQCNRYDPELKVYNADDPNDDWFILPKLSENNKLISFWAKSLSTRYGNESFDIMVSTESDDIEDFELFAQAKEVPAGYASSIEKGFTLYEFDLPEETQYAAIRYNAAGTLALLIDDLTYTPEGVYSEAHLLGYNIYRNDVRINAEPLSETELNDIPAEDGSYYYNVTAVYAEGESPYSNTVTVADFSEVENVSAADRCNISVENNSIVVTSPAPAVAAVYSPDGRQLRNVSVSGKAIITMAPGIYIVKADSVTRTVVIK